MKDNEKFKRTFVHGKGKTMINAWIISFLKDAAVKMVDLNKDGKLDTQDLLVAAKALWSFVGKIIDKKVKGEEITTDSLGELIGDVEKELEAI